MLIPANISNTMIVTTRAISVIPLFPFHLIRQKRLPQGGFVDFAADVVGTYQ